MRDYIVLQRIERLLRFIAFKFDLCLNKSVLFERTIISLSMNRTSSKINIFLYFLHFFFNRLLELEKTYTT